MKTWQVLIPVCVVAVVALAVEKRGHDAAIADLRSEMATLERRGVSPQTPSTTSTPAAKPKDASEMREALENAFRTEGTDAEWGDGAKRLATDRLRTAVPAGSEVRKVDCHTSMCRIETAHPDRSHYERFVRSAFMDPASSLWNAEAYSSFVGDHARSAESLLVVSYLAREGRSLPD